MSAALEIASRFANVLAGVSALFQPEPVCELAASGLARAELQQTDGSDDDSVSPAVRAAGTLWRLRRQGAASSPIALTIPRELCFRRITTIPASAASRAAAILDIEFAGLSPVAANAFMGGMTVASTETAKGQSDVEHILLHRDIASEIVDQLRQAGVSVGALLLLPLNDSGRPIILETSGALFGRSQFRWWLKATAVSLMGLTAAAVLAMSAITWQAASVINRLQEEQAALQESAKKVRAQLAARQDKEAAVTAIAQWNTSNANAINAIEVLSALLPDSAYLDTLAIDGTSISLDGAAQAPEPLISTLEASPAFEGAAFAAPVYRNQTDALARFAIKVKLEGDARPGDAQ